jgi:hypothetical protein
MNSLTAKLEVRISPNLFLRDGRYRFGWIWFKIDLAYAI